MSYALLGKRARVHLYNKDGTMLASIEGRIADFAGDVPLSGGTVKDLILLADIETPDGEPYTNSAGGENEGWFALSDATIIDESTGPITNMSFN